MNKFTRVFFLVLDACGIGELPDAGAYGDRGSATIPNIAKAVGGLTIPNLEAMGLGKIEPITGVCSGNESIAAFGKMAELSAGKDSTSGHWEHMGVILETPFPVYPNGFPDEVILPFEEQTGYEIIGNEAASGTEIIQRLGREHFETKKLIVYTSADSVFQVAAHETIIPVDELYHICKTARKILTGKHGVGRVIARPFTGEPGQFTRTSRRKDFSIEPTLPFVNQKLAENKIEVVSVGKIYDLMAGLGITKRIGASGNKACMKEMVELTKTMNYGLAMINLVDFDMLWGHRNDYQSFAAGLEEFDLQLPEFLTNLRNNDLLIITADHGCDPTTESTDHSREYVPLLAYYKNMPKNINLGIRASFADTGKTIAENFGIEFDFPGESFLGDLF
ncbi:MAG: phosphopentomutase [candidate division Zixibacteria bacterium]|nr:phosphopentomutase [candidate division Zixibacteria bacterium]